MSRLDLITLVYVRVESRDIRQRIWKELVYSRKRMGRCLKEPIAELGLLAGDRLEPSSSVMDVGAFKFLETPFVATFWRMKDEDRLIHNSPLWCIPGFGLKTLTIDALHTWVFGPLAFYTGFVLRFCLVHRVWCQDLPYIDSEEYMRLNLLRCRADLWSYYYHRRRDGSDWTRHGSEVWNLTLKMLGTAKTIG